MHALLRTSQNLQVPSLETEANCASRLGFQAMRSMPPVWPRNSVLFLTCGLSGFHTRSVRSAEPVAIRDPVGFHAIDRMLEVVSEVRQRKGAESRTYGSWTLETMGRDKSES